MQLLFFSCLLAAAAVASPLLWEKDCVKGPEIWCQNLRTASQCGAVKHCQQTVWNKPSVKSIPCDLCKEVVTVAGNLLKDNSTEGEIRSYIEKICEFLPDQGLVSECKETVDAYLPVVMDLIKEEFDNPEVLCSALCLCQSLQKHLAAMKLQKQLQSNKIPELDFSELASPFMANVPLLLYPQDKPKQESQGAGDVCKDCVQLVTDVQEAVRTNSSFVTSLIAHAKEECERLGPAAADLCKDYISQYSDLAIQMMMHMQDQQPKAICAMVGFCPSLKSVPLLTLVPAKVMHEVKMESVEEMQKNLVQAETFSVCDICETMVKEVTNLLENNRTEEEIVFEMEKLCLVFPQSIKDQCKDFVETYGKAVIDMLLEATSPETVCIMLKCCTSRKPSPEVRIASEPLQAGDFCDVCKMVVHYLEKQLEKNATAAEIEAALEKVCHFLPESISEECVQFVDQYEPMLLTLLAEIMDPTFVCSKLGVCVSTKQHLLGSEECVWGPGYWCKNMETAAQCNAVEHCKRHVWN
ncbi:prosaposin isoform X1 [Terrapene carolina triunguis]|uniref:prosaposin isoform X1 n=1 Tax=Terrapene triunguis TaxID=2587831 RepID=UPI000E775B86|nr:prosaposin isoform X1 [Terrapene carolina triunguis]